MEKFVLGKKGFEDPSLQKGFGTSAEGLPVIAIGVKGGKIVGYDSKGKPIYAGSSGAKKLAEQKGKEKETKAPEQKKPTASQVAAQAAPDPFPKDLGKLKQVEAGKFAGSHGNKLFEHPNGQRFIFKAQNILISKAEEAASRIASLLFPGRVQAAKFVKHTGTEGALIKVEEGYTPIGKESSSMEVSPALQKKFQKHFDDIVKHHVVDWCIAQHDSHGDNLGLVDGKVFAIDKGQAWKFLGQDKLPKAGTEASEGANPNPSKQVYSQFWKAFHDGKIQGDPVKAASEVFSKLEALSDDQLKAIVTPYAEVAAKKKGTSVSAQMKPIMDRLKEAKSNWEWFLDKEIPTSSEAAAGEPTVDTAGQFTDPAAPPKGIEKTPIPKTGFVPVKKSTVTLINPGSANEKPFPGYPGVGYEATVSYKKQDYTLQFMPDAKVGVLYPDGSVAMFDTPNAACDSLYLWKNGLDLNLSAKEKKAKGISYSATKMLKLKEFSKELEEYGVPPAAPPPPKGDTYTLKDMVEEHGNGPLNLAMVPPEVQEWAKAVQKDGDGPGTVYVTGLNLVLPFYDSEGTPAFKSWAVLDNGNLQALPPISATGVGDDTFPGVPALPPKKKPVGPAPAAEKQAKDTEVSKPVDAPSISPGPLPDGAQVETTKKFKDASKKQKVVLGFEDGKYKVAIPHAMKAAEFDSLSAASDYVWTVQKGYDGVEDYKKKTGKKKVPSGGGWKFWGLKPGDVPTATESKDNFETMPDTPSEPEASATPPEATEPAPTEMPTDSGAYAGVKFVKEDDVEPSDWTDFDFSFSPTTTQAKGQLKFLKDLPVGSQVSIAVKPPNVHAIDAVKAENGSWNVEGVGTLQPIDLLSSIQSQGQVEPGDVVTVAVKPAASEAASEKLKEEMKNFNWWFKAGEGMKLEGYSEGGSKYEWDFDGVLTIDGVNKGVAISTAQDVFLGLKTVKLLSPADQVKPPPAPKAADVIQKMPSEMTPAEQGHTVKSNLPLVEAFQHLEYVKQHPEIFIKPSAKKAGLYNICTNKSDINNDQGSFLLEELKQKYELKTFAGHPKANGLGAFMTINEEQAQALFEVNIPAGDLNPTASKNNFETMPDVSGPAGDAKDAKKKKTKLKTIAKSLSINKKLEKLSALSPGDQVVFGDGSSFTKLSGTPAQYEANGFAGIPDGVAFMDFAVAQQVGFKGGCKLLPKGQELPTKLPKPAPPKSVPKPQPPPEDLEKKAKQDWAKIWKTPSQDVMKHVSYLAAAAGLEGEELYVRQDGDFIAIGTGSPGSAKDLLEVSSNAEIQNSPFGDMLVLAFPDLLKSTPKAATIKGPDGVTYPVGTTFEETKVFKTKGELLQNEPISKVADYIGSETAKYGHTVKIVGTSPEEKKKAEDLQKKYGIDTPIKVGGHYTLFPLPKGFMSEKSDEFTVEVQPSIPEQPAPVKQKGLGVLSGPANYGAPAPNNRDDLANLDAVTPGRFGHRIACGEGGVFMDGGLRVFRVKMPDGKVVNRIVGELTRPPKGFLQSNIKPSFTIAEKPHSVLKDWGPENNFDPATGTHNLGTATLWSKGDYAAKGKELPNGVKVYAWGSSITTLQRHVMVEVPEGVDAEQALTDAFTAVEVDPAKALATPDDVDQRIMSKQQILRAVIGPKGHQEVQKLRMKNDAKSREEWEAVLDNAIKGKVAKKWVDKAEVVSGPNGQHTVRMSDLDDKIGVDKDLKAVVTGISWKGMVNMLMQGGYGAQWHRCMTGNSKYIDDSSGGTASGADDMESGGAFGIFARLISSKNKSHGIVGSGKPKVVWHPRVLRQTNWYAHNGDAFGNQGYDGVARKNIATAMTSSTNELVFEDLSIEDIGGFIVATQGEKDEFVATAKKGGITELNGLPLADCITVHAVSSGLDAAAKNLPLMKEPI